MSSRPTTLRDLASHTGLSIMTVSCILRNDIKRFGPHTVERVRRAALELRYDPSRFASARRLRYSRIADSRVLNDCVALHASFAVTDGPYFYRLLHGLGDALGREKIALLTNFHFHTIQTDCALPAIIQRGEVDGALLISGMGDLAKTTDLLRGCPGFGTRPIVSMMADQPGCSCLLVDDEAGGHALMSHLIALGHRQIFHCGFQQWQHVQRIKGIRRACRENGLDPKTALINLSPQGDPSASLLEERPLKERLLQGLSRHPDCKAIFAGNDMTALRLAGWLAALGVQIPQDMSLVGFDDTHVLPGPNGSNLLTTVRIPLHEVGEQSALLLLDRICNATDEPKRVTLPVELIVRGSTGEA